jgi:hypothetical protein
VGFGCADISPIGHLVHRSLCHPGILITTTQDLHHFFCALNRDFGQSIDSIPVVFVLDQCEATSGCFTIPCSLYRLDEVLEPLVVDLKV